MLGEFFIVSPEIFQCITGSGITEKCQTREYCRVRLLLDWYLLNYGRTWNSRTWEYCLQCLVSFSFQVSQTIIFQPVLCNTTTMNFVMFTRYLKICNFWRQWMLTCLILSIDLVPWHILSLEKNICFFMQFVYEKCVSRIVFGIACIR